MRAFGVVSILLCARVAAGQPDTNAADLFAEGRALLAAGHAAEACTKFTAALELEPDAIGPILNLGVCNEQQDKLATALRWYQRAQARASELRIDGTAQAAQDKLGALAARVPTLHVAFSAPPPAGTQTTIDGAAVAMLDLRRVEIDAGHHVVEIAFASGRRLHRELDVIDRDANTIDIDVALATTPDPEIVRARVVAQAAHDREAQRAHARKRLAYIIGGAGLAVLAGDAVFAVVVKQQADATESPYTLHTLQLAARYGGTSAFVLGLGAVGAAIWLYATPPRAERPQTASAPVVPVVPVVGPDVVGLATMGVF